MLLDELEKKRLIQPPSFVISNCVYLTITGSHAYGVADTNVRDTVPDFDVQGVAIPPKDYIFPSQFRGEILGFGTRGPTFEKPWQKHHIMDVTANGGKGKEYDLCIYGIVRFFQLCMENNPNMLDLLFTPENCMLHCTQVGRMIRDNRKLFVSKLAWKTCRGYAFSQAHKMKSKETINDAMEFRKLEESMMVPHSTTLKDVEFVESLREGSGFDPGRAVELQAISDSDFKLYADRFRNEVAKSKRFQMIKVYNFDVKFGYHVLRLIDEASQLLSVGEMDLQRAREAMKSVRRGEWTADEICDWMKQQEKALETVYLTSKLREVPDEAAIKDLLVRCLEEHYGNLETVINQGDWAARTLGKIDDILNQVRPQLYGTAK